MRRGAIAQRLLGRSVKPSARYVCALGFLLRSAVKTLLLRRNYIVGKITYCKPEVRAIPKSRKKAIQTKRKVLKIEEEEAREAIAMLNSIEEIEMMRFYDTYLLLSADMGLYCKSDSIEP